MDLGTMIANIDDKLNAIRDEKRAIVSELTTIEDTDKRNDALFRLREIDNEHYELSKRRQSLTH